MVRMPRRDRDPLGSLTEVQHAALCQQLAPRGRCSLPQINLGLQGSGKQNATCLSPRPSPSARWG